MNEKLKPTIKDDSNNEIIEDKKSENSEKGITINIDRPNLLFSLVLVLGILAVMQTYFLIRLSNQVSTQEAKELVTNSQSSTSTKLEELKDLPDMVGGC